jgi:hypothetical protein
VEYQQQVTFFDDGALASIGGLPEADANGGRQGPGWRNDHGRETIRKLSFWQQRVNVKYQTSFGRCGKDFNKRAVLAGDGEKALEAAVAALEARSPQRRKDSTVENPQILKFGRPFPLARVGMRGYRGGHEGSFALSVSQPGLVFLL